MVSQAGPERALAAAGAGGKACAGPGAGAAPGQIPPAHQELPFLLQGALLPAVEHWYLWLPCLMGNALAGELQPLHWRCWLHRAAPREACKKPSRATGELQALAIGHLVQRRTLAHSFIVPGGFGHYQLGGHRSPLGSGRYKGLIRWSASAAVQLWFRMLRGSQSGKLCSPAAAEFWHEAVLCSSP